MSSETAWDINRLSYGSLIRNSGLPYSHLKAHLFVCLTPLGHLPDDDITDIKLSICHRNKNIYIQLELEVHVMLAVS
jgi:hypothetical protein